MSANAGPDIVEDGIVFYYDTGNTVKSYIGEPSTNLALFSMQGSFNADYSGVTFTDAPGQGYQGRDAKRVVANSGQWNIYRYPRSGNYTNTSSTKFTYSFKIKWADGHTPYFSNGYIYVDAETTYPGITVRAIDNGWFWCYCTYNGTSSPPWLTGFSTSDNGACLISDWQLEPGLLHPTQYITPGGTRSATQGLLDMTGNRIINIANVSFDSNAQMTFDGTNDYGQSNAFVPSITSKSYEAVTRLYDVNQQAGGVIGMMGENGEPFDTIVYNETDQGWGFGSTGFERTAWSGVKETTTGFVHLVATYENYNYKLYRNGVLILTTTSYAALNYNFNTVVIFGKRHGTTTGPLNGEIPLTKIYNRVLTASEVLTNYNALKTRFGI
jgi:hypothetical protein